MLAGAAVLLLVVLWQWSNRLAPPPAPADRATSPSEPVADGGPQWGEPRPVTFPGERCRPWHISAAGDFGAVSSPLLLISRLADPYGLVAAGFVQECGRPTQTVVVEEVDAGKELVLYQGAVAAVGAAAVDWYHRRRPEGALVFAAVPDPWRRGWHHPPLAGISPWLPAEALLAHVHKVLPVRAPLGLLAGEKVEPAFVEALVQAGRDVGRPFHSYRYSDQESLRQRLELAATEAGAWLVLWDASAAFEEAFQLILRRAEKARLPVAVSDEDHVRQGALAGVGPDSFRIGQQLCRLLKAQQAGRLPATGRVFCPEYSFAVLHLARAEKLGYVFDPAQHPQIKVYKWH